MPAGRKEITYEGYRIRLRELDRKKIFQSSSRRSICFSVITDGMTVEDYYKEAKAKGIEPFDAKQCLRQMANPYQQYQVIYLEQGGINED